MNNPEQYRDAALIIAGHGSTLNPDSSAPTFLHADAIRARGIFAEVHVCFWKEEPNFNRVLDQVQAEKIYIVPNFISSGYFTQEVLPREFGLGGPVTRLGDRTIYYCEPVGLHPSMTQALLSRAAGVVHESGESIADPRRDTCLFICGHGTSLNDNSTKIIYDQVAQIRERGVYAECQACFMEQSPFVKDWRSLTTAANVIVVPFFIADGLHSYEDIPILLGVGKGPVRNPHRESNRRLWYASAIGTEPRMADVILAQVQNFNEAVGTVS